MNGILLLSPAATTQRISNQSASPASQRTVNQSPTAATQRTSNRSSAPSTQRASESHLLLLLLDLIPISPSNLLLLLQLLYPKTPRNGSKAPWSKTKQKRKRSMLWERHNQVQWKKKQKRAVSCNTKTKQRR